MGSPNEGAPEISTETVGKIREGWMYGQELL